MSDKKPFVPFVSPETNMAEFTVRALIIGLVMAVVLGAANAYLGLKAGMTIAATYPAAVIGMAILRLMKGTILEENFARTVGSIGESIAAGAIFTIPAFYIAGIWDKNNMMHDYFIASAIMFSGGILGIMFVALLRRVMVEDRDLPFPESVAASEIHKAGRSGGTGAKFLFQAMGIGALIQALGQFKLFASSWEHFISFARKGIDLRKAGTATAEGGILVSSPGISPAYMGVGYIIGPKLASLNFSGGLLAWGFLVPIITYFAGPSIMPDLLNLNPKTAIAHVSFQRDSVHYFNLAGSDSIFLRQILKTKNGEKVSFDTGRVVLHPDSVHVADGVYTFNIPAEQNEITTTTGVFVQQAKHWFWLPAKCFDLDPTEPSWILLADMIWRFIVRPIAIGGMLVGAGLTLFRMRKSLATGIARSVSDVKKAATGETTTLRTDKDLNFKLIVLGILFAGAATFLIYNFFAQNVFAALVATVVMIVTGFFFAAVSGYLVGIIGSSNNPISGLTLSTLIVAALLMVMLGMKGNQGVAAVLGVAAVVCVSAAVAGEMLQDLKVGHILGGTPWRMQFGDIIGVAIASAVMFIPLLVLQQGDVIAGKTASVPYEGGFGSAHLAAPQAGLMALLSQGIVKGEMAWPLIIVGMLFGFGLILMQVKSPMLVAVGMYLPLETTFAIFLGGMVKAIVEMINARRKFNDAQKARVENNGVLLAAGLIAGEALIGLVFAALAFKDVKLFEFFKDPSIYVSLAIIALISLYLVFIPVKHAGEADEPAPPTAVM
jgi:putative OPT family oligopeptide transporter